MLSLFGHALSSDASVALVKALRKHGGAEAGQAADRIELVAASEFSAITLTDGQRASVIAMLKDLDEDAASALKELASQIAISDQSGLRHEM